MYFFTLINFYNDWTQTRATTCHFDRESVYGEKHIFDPPGGQNHPKSIKKALIFGSNGLGWP